MIILFVKESGGETTECEDNIVNPANAKKPMLCRYHIIVPHVSQHPNILEYNP